MRKIYLLLAFMFLLSSFASKNALAQDAKLVDSLTALIINGSEDTLKAKYLNDLVWYIKFSDPDTSLILLDQSESLSRKLDFADGLGNSYNNRAIIYTVSGDFDDAVKYYSMANEQFERNSDAEGVGFCFSNMAICYEYQSMFDSALVYNQKALEVRKKYDLQKGIAQSNINIGVIYFNKGFYRLALKHYLDALNFYENKTEKSAIDKSYLGSVQTNLGNIYIELNDLKNARKYLNGAVENFTEVGDSRELAYLNNELGDVEQLSGNFREAKQYFQDALNLARQSDDKLIEVSALLNLSTNYLQTGKLDESWDFAREGLSVAEDISDSKYAIGMYQNLGEINMQRDRVSEAISFFKKALSEAEEAGIIKQKEEILYQLAECYSMAGNFSTANIYLKKHIVAADSVFDEEKYRQISEMEAIYENEKKTRQLELKEAENTILQNENETQAAILTGKNRLIVSILIGLILLSAALVLLSFQYRRKNAAYQALYEKSLEQLEKNKLKKSREGLKNGDLFDLIEQKMQFDQLYRIKDLNQDMVADMMKTNRTYVSQAIIDHSGKKFREYIKDYRIGEAMEILSDPKRAMVYSIEAIADDVGFNSIATFNAAFKQFTGLTPSQFRSQAGK
jgi:tetratricopeptide (TPR) repeat protein